MVYENCLAFIDTPFILSFHFETPNDTAYAYSGYASLLVRIIEEGIKLRWAAWNKIGEEIFPNGKIKQKYSSS